MIGIVIVVSHFRCIILFIRTFSDCCLFCMIDHRHFLGGELWGAGVMGTFGI